MPTIPAPAAVPAPCLTAVLERSQRPSRRSSPTPTRPNPCYAVPGHGNLRSLPRTRVPLLPVTRDHRTVGCVSSAGAETLRFGGQADPLRARATSWAASRSCPNQVPAQAPAAETAISRPWRRLRRWTGSSRASSCWRTARTLSLSRAAGAGPAGRPDRRQRAWKRRSGPKQLADTRPALREGRSR